MPQIRPICGEGGGAQSIPESMRKGRLFRTLFPKRKLQASSSALLLVSILLFPLSVLPIAYTTPMAEPAEPAENQSTWIPFVPGAEPGTRSQVVPKSSDTMGLCVDSNFFGMYSLTTYINETRYNVLHVPNAGHTSVVGKPAVPVVTHYLEVPENVQGSIEIVYVDMQVLEDSNVVSAQEPLVDFANAMRPPFVIDETTYATDAYYPSEVAYLEGGDGFDPIVIRGHRIVALSLCPVQFNPVSQQIRVYSKIEVRISYEKPGQVGPLDMRLYSPAFETLLDAIVLNYESRPLYGESWRILGGTQMSEANPGNKELLEKYGLYEPLEEEAKAAPEERE